MCQRGKTAFRGKCATALASPHSSLHHIVCLCAGLSGDCNTAVRGTPGPPPTSPLRSLFSSSYSSLCPWPTDSPCHPSPPTPLPPPPPPPRSSSSGRASPLSSLSSSSILGLSSLGLPAGGGGGGGGGWVGGGGEVDRLTPLPPKPVCPSDWLSPASHKHIAIRDASTLVRSRSSINTSLSVVCKRGESPLCLPLSSCLTVFKPPAYAMKRSRKISGIQRRREDKGAKRSTLPVPRSCVTPA